MTRARAFRGAHAMKEQTKPWFIYGQRKLSLRDRLKLLLGWKLYVRFDSPDGACHAACNLSHQLSRREADKIEWTQPCPPSNTQCVCNASTAAGNA